MTTKPVPIRVLACALLAVGFIASLPRRGQSEEAPASRDQQIADLQKQIGDLQKKLADLKKDNGTTSVAPAGNGGLSPDQIKPLEWRSIGPANMGGRIIAVSVFEADPTTYWVATASGGLLKTSNNGITFEHQFDREATVSIGDVCVAPSDRNIVWVGTGENNPRNSVSYGDGVYKSTDGGKTWKNMGLKKTFQTGRIAIHPKNPNIVYVGTLGRLYGPNPDRGLFKTSDGGQSWEKILFVDDKTGIIDLQLNPNEPETLLVATYERQRDSYDTNDPSKKFGPGTALYKTTDGGQTFKKLTKGLPTCQLGRMGISYFRINPNTVFVILESEKIGMGTPPIYMGVQGENAPEGKGAKLTQIVPGGPGEKAGLKIGDVITAIEDKPVKTYTEITAAIRGRKPDDKIKLKIIRDDKPVEVELILGTRPRNQQGPGRIRPIETGVFAGFFGDYVEGEGLRLTRIIEDSAAAQANLQEGDIVISYAGKPVKSNADLAALNQDRKPRDKVKLKINRSGKEMEVEMTLAGRPAGGFGGERADPSRFYGAQLGGQSENVQEDQGAEGYQYGGVYKSTDGGESWTRINSINPRPMYFSQIRVDPSDDNYLYVLGVSMYRSSDGGKSFRADGGRGVHADQHALWIDPKDGRHIIVGCDGGFYVTYDRMATWDHLNHLAIGQFYHCAVDSRPRNYYVYGGLQDNGSWGGPSSTRSVTGPVNQDWISVGGGDGFVCRVDPNDHDQIYYESQNGGFGRRNLRTGETASIRPRAPQGTRYRFNWNSPFILANQNSKIYYCAGNFVFRSLDRGNDLRAISPEITRTDKGSATALAESPRNPNVLYVGTDDGNLWVTKDGGKEWTNITTKVGLAGARCVATIEPSRHADGRCYVAFDGHRQDDDNPLVYETEDFGQTWKPLRANLPWGSTRCLREDISNPNLLFVGTEFAVWVSVDRGTSWTRLNNNLPTVAVHDFAIHPTAGEMVAATHGRSLWILDITPLRQMTPEVLKAGAHLYQSNPAVRQRMEPRRGGTNRQFVGQNSAFGAQIYYHLDNKPEKINLKIVDYTGKTIRELRADSNPGLHKVGWDLAQAPAGRQGGGQPASGQGGRTGGRAARTGGQPTTGRPGGTPAQPPMAQPGETAPATQTPVETPQEQAPRGGPGGFGGFGGRGGFGGGQQVPPGMYRVVLTVDGKEFTQGLRVEGDAGAPATIFADDDDDEETDDGPSIIK
ncbi:MAG TPA: PDZ domain-containing protein [Gemmataceae bacterium]|nr:PDZ domain-containing protein [Gemmataceae bacterium]